jgi:hypothetical protein
MFRDRRKKVGCCSELVICEMRWLQHVKVACGYGSRQITVPWNTQFKLEVTCRHLNHLCIPELRLHDVLRPHNRHRDTLTGAKA